MFELVLHHNYRAGNARDLSGNDNHGLLVQPLAAEGSQPSTAALGFDGLHTRVVVFPSESLVDLGAIRFSARLWLQDLGQRRNLLEGFLSFSLMIEEDGTLQAKVYDGTRWDGIWSPPGAVPLRRWVQVHWIYDGHDTSALYLDEQLLARRYRPLGRVH
ncbi:MAG: hypothetical protein EHM56_06655, partial [Chloroflexi bacterium]